MPASSSLRDRQRARSSRTRDDEFDAGTVGFGARNFSDLRAACARWPASSARAGASWCSRSPRRTDRRCRPSSTLWFDRIVPVLGRVAGDPDAYNYLPNSVRRFPAPEALAAVHVARPGCATSRYVLTAGGIIALHVGRGAPRA